MPDLGKVVYIKFFVLNLAAMLDDAKSPTIQKVLLLEITFPRSGRSAIGVFFKAIDFHYGNLLFWFSLFIFMLVLQISLSYISQIVVCDLFVTSEFFIFCGILTVKLSQRSHSNVRSVCHWSN